MWKSYSEGANAADACAHARLNVQIIVYFMTFLHLLYERKDEKRHLQKPKSDRYLNPVFLDPVFFDSDNKKTVCLFFVQNVKKARVKVLTKIISAT